jgi:hypothetical protein
MIGTQIYRGQGLGNQLWTYAVTRSIALKNGYQFGIAGDRFFQLNKYIQLDYGNPIITTLVENPVYRIPQGFEYYYAEEKIFHPKYKCDISPLDTNLTNISDATFIDGNMQAEMYISEFKNEISGWLEVKDKVFDGCTIHFRGIEYAGLKDVLLSQEYYKNAMRYMTEKYGEVEFRVVTDDFKLAKIYFPDLKILGRNKYRTLVDSELKPLKDSFSLGPNQTSIARDFSAIQNSRYLIIPNSSFSWWAAWTNRIAKEVVAPKYWASHNFSDGFWATGDILTQGWTWLDRFNDFKTSEECGFEKESYV